MIGSRISAYEVLAELGSGGMGAVYLARCAAAVAGLEEGAQVALKVIHPNLLSQPGFFKRFLREARVGQAVRHSNVVQTYDCDATDVDGTAAHFLVMEYVEGQTLRSLLDELGRVPEELCRHIGCEVARGLAAIHEAGVIHRDVKPENVLITEEHVVKVMDLGVARLQDEAIRLSRAGSFVGSLEYAAPEQFRSADGEPDGRADLYSLGVVLYELATGQHPFRDEDASRVLRNVLDVEPRKAGEVNPQLSPFFEEVIGTLIAKAPGERFADATALARVLDEGEGGAWWGGRARALRLETKRPLRRIRIPRETALYGRDEDLARLHALFDKAKAGEGQVVLIEGEAGIGKTRLVDEFVGRLGQDGEDINFLFGSYPPGGAATAAGAFSEAYREQFGAEGLEDALAQYLSPTPILIPAFAAVLRGETTPKDVEQLTKDSLQTVFVHATRGLAAERTTVVLIDDLHFAPEDGRALFTSLALAVPGHRVLLLGTMRPGVPREWIADVTRLEHAEQRSLSRLGPRDLVSLLKESFRSERLAHELSAQIAIKCDGNPFFAFEVIRGLREGQFIAQQADGTWVTTRVIEDIQVPSSVLDLVNARVADLTEDERDLLDVAACCGFEFDPSLVGQVLGVARISALKRLAQIERRHRLVLSVGRSYVFDHHQVQAALYGALNEQLREEYHAAIAEALEARRGADGREPGALGGSLCVDICEHFLMGARGEDALRYLDAALDHLEAGCLNDPVAALAERALAVPDLIQGERRLTLLLRMNGRLQLLGRRRAQEVVLAEAHALAKDAQLRVPLMKVECALGLVAANTGHFQVAKEHHENELALAREVGDEERRVEATVNLGVVLYHLGRWEEARATFEQGITLARKIGARQFEANATGNLGNVAFALGQNEEARALYETNLAIARELGSRRGEATAVGNLGLVSATLGRHEEARACFEQQLSVAREIGDRQQEARVKGHLGIVLFARGLYGEAMVQLEGWLAIAREIDDRLGQALALASRGMLWSSLGRRDRGARELQESLALCREIGSRRSEGYALQALSDLAREQGDVPRALDLAREALDLRREIGHEAGVPDSLLQTGDLHEQAGDVGAARDALRVAVDMFRQQERKAELAQALALLALLPDGDASEAEAALLEAGEAGSTPEVRYHLWKATGKREHLAEARRLLDHRVEHAPEAYRESLLENVRLNREIMQAWRTREPGRADGLAGGA